MLFKLLERLDSTIYTVSIDDCLDIIKSVLGISANDLSTVVDITDIEAIYNYAYTNKIDINRIIWQSYKDYSNEDDKLYLVHGSRSGINGNIRLDASGVSNDFSNGFYCGTDIAQAAMFVADEDGASLYIVEFDPSDLKCARFKVDLDWLIAVAYYRGTLDKYKDSDKVKAVIKYVDEADYIIAPIADNRMFETIDAFTSGKLTDEQCMHAIASIDLGMQYVFKKPSTLSHISIIQHLHLCGIEKTMYSMRGEVESNTSMNKAIFMKNKLRNSGNYINDILG